jgi:hypothetical protein
MDSANAAAMAAHNNGHGKSCRMTTDDQWHCMAMEDANVAEAAAHNNRCNNLCCMMTEDAVASHSNGQY